MVKCSWFKDKVPEYLNIKQVYGIAFSYDGNIVLRFDDNKYKLTGRKPYDSDKSLEDTLKREHLEELNIEIEDIYYLGYLLVEGDAKEKYAQIRMLAKIKNIGEVKPDIDRKTYKRFMANIKNVKQYLNYPDLAGNLMIDDAIKLAKEKYNINFRDTNNEYFI